MKAIKVIIKYSGLLSEAIEKSFDVIEVREGASLRELLEELATANPALRRWLDIGPPLTILVNGSEILSHSKVILRDGDEVTIMPPLYEGG